MKGAKGIPKRLLRNSFSAQSGGIAVQNPSPGGASDISPALQRWGKWEELSKSRRDDRVS
jgi:hypothetical protein